MDAQEKILVLVRLRPLSEKEVAKNEVVDWESINDTTILYRNSLQEHSGHPTAYTYDRVFRGDCSTKEVYEEGVEEIVLSVVKGINSTIFAYGQTSSGKTYTMTGITEYAVADIYDYMHKHEERAYVLKFSAIEIYNEAVRDLLGKDDLPLRVLDDPEKGTIVERLTEETLRDINHLKHLLSVCQALRRTEETSLNETSSRSHQILRLVWLSQTYPVSNFVDLAGSERASQAMSAGTRLKEGCHINRSLLTLGTVIRKLSKGKQGHVNYRDSKLTRILQSSLGGNARTAIICTLSPARSHLEQSRNTLLFASCAKEVSTNARVNVVISDKPLVQQLRKQIAMLESELETLATIDTDQDYAALLRKKNLQIEKMEKEIQEISRQRDLAEARVEELLLVIESLQSSEKMDKHDQECLEASDSNLKDNAALDEVEDLSNLNVHQGQEDTNTITSISTETLPNSSNPVNHVENGFTYHTLGQKIPGVQRVSDSLMTESNHDEFLQVSSARETLGCEPLKSSKDQNCRTYVSGSSPFFQEKMEQKENHQTTTLEELKERTERLQRNHMPLQSDGDRDSPSRLRSNSQSSTENAFVEPHVQTMRTWEEDDVTSIHNFVKELKEAQLQFEEQLDSQETPLHEKESKDITSEYPEAKPDWPQEFERLQKAIIKLWQSCSVSLVHRTYFFLLFKGDPTDSIYMEVELRRLAFLKQTFSNQNVHLEDGQSCPIDPSAKALHRERKMLSRLMQKRYTKEERSVLFKKWGIELDSKKRKLQLLNSIWTSTDDYQHITESTEIVARLIKFSEQGQAIKGMFGLSFSTPQRRHQGWRSSLATLIESGCPSVVLNSSTTKPQEPPSSK
ncbi:hypothetical protein QQ045_014850 [Rhodiola kirilowii]